MRFLTFLLPFLVACASLGPAVPTDSDNQPERLLRHVVGLVDPMGDAYCSGVQVERGVLTAAHCVDGTAEVLVGARTGYDPYEGRWAHPTLGRVLKVDEARDLALVEFRGQHPAETVGSPELGTPIWAIGHPGSYGYTVHRGIVSSETRYDHNQSWFGVDAGLLPGMSGGPVFNDAGEVVGLVSFMLVVAGEARPHLGGCIPGDEIRGFLLP